MSGAVICKCRMGWSFLPWLVLGTGAPAGGQWTNSARIPLKLDSPRRPWKKLRYAIGARGMIDVYRFILALCVVQGHLVGQGESAPWLAWQAVFSFYVLSGFLMSFILNQDYGFTAGGLVRFAINRWLRLFPIYYAVIGLTALYIAFIGPLNQLNQAITLPSTGTAIFANLSIVTLMGFDFDPVMQRLSPTT
jgi:peptidoglycan/LPS O-acetylase OafA/YrhL